MNYVPSNLDLRLTWLAGRKLREKHGNHCPYCGNLMMKPGLTEEQAGHNESRGHLCSRKHSRRNHQQWVFCCYTCNQDQGILSLTEWYDELLKAEDKRARRVRDVIRFLRPYMANQVP